MASIGHNRGHVFISYAQDNARDVDYIQNRLEYSGILVWRDKASLWPGDRWREAIRKAIADNSIVFLACFSRDGNAHARSYQNEELNLALEEMRQRPHDDTWLIPVRFDDCEIPEWDIGGGDTLKSIQQLDLFGENLAIGVGKLIATVRRILIRHDSDIHDQRQTTQDVSQTGNVVNAASGVETVNLVRCSKCGRLNQQYAFFCDMCAHFLRKIQPGRLSTFDLYRSDDDGDVIPTWLLDDGNNAILVVKRGPDKGGVFQINKISVTLGRAPESDIYLEDSSVSRQHAVIFKQDDVRHIKDLGSVNGVFVNGQRIDSAPLSIGDAVVIGVYRLIYYQ